MTRESITALHCQAAADIWRESGSPAQQKFIPDFAAQALSTTRSGHAE